MVKLNKIYTRTGDDGQTVLVNGQRVAKHAKRPAAFGEVDELNSVIGMARNFADNTDIDESKLYTKPEEVNYAYERLIKISPNFMIAAAFGNVHGVYKSIDGGVSWEETLWRTVAIKTSKRDHAHAIDIVINQMLTMVHILTNEITTKL